jgi:natural product biosynthesis luciferase-like monooxygenase protein
LTLRFGLMFFASHPGGTARERYATTLAAAALADAAGLAAVWTPERHFDGFGGAFPNPAVMSAALVAATERIQIRAGSLISPVHHAVRIAEDWSVVDNLGGGGRVGVSFGSGWNANDFVLAPDRYDDRRAVMARQIEEVRTLWRGGALTLPNPRGVATEIRLHPRPVSPELPIWVTSSGNPETFERAGALGAHLLTHLIGQNLDELAGKLARYRKARARAGLDPAAGVVSLMLHTFVDDDGDRARALTREPFREYLRSAVVLERKSAGGGGTISGGHALPAESIPDDLIEELLDVTYERYVRDAALIGSPDELVGYLRGLAEIGVDEIAALIDFGPTDEQILAHLPMLFRLAERVA